jgi:hypothetical protein
MKPVGQYLRPGHGGWLDLEVSEFFWRPGPREAPKFVKSPYSLRQESRYFRSFPESIRGPATFRGMVPFPSWSWQGRLNSETPWNSNVLRISKSAKTLVLMFMISLWWFLMVYWLKDPSTAINRLPQADGGRKPLWRLGVSADLPEVFDPRSTASWPGSSWHCIIQWNGALNLQLASKQPWLQPQKGES